MKSSNIWRIIWIVGIYAILVALLYLVVLYKVQWEDKDLNTYLYFYDCSYNLCTSTTKPNDYYSKFMCENDECPFITDIIDDNVILSDGNRSWLFNYVKGSIVNDLYSNYKYISNNNFIVTNKEGKQGVISTSGDVLAEFDYDYIDNYLDGLVSYRKDNLYGINSSDSMHNVDAKFEHIILINDNIYGGRKDNVYHIYNFNNTNSEFIGTYDYMYGYMDLIFVVYNKKIDILTTDLKSTLLMKIDTFYEYKTEKVRDSLDIHSDLSNVYFKVYNEDGTYTSYTYDVLSKKLK